MVTFLVILSLLSGWMISKLKDFFINGGITNSLAFTLLKIIFISALMLINGALIIGSHVVVKLWKNFLAVWETPELKIPRIPTRCNPLQRSKFVYSD